MNHIGTLAEKSLHAEIKKWYGRADDQFEQPVAGFVIDIVRGEQLIEIQTANFGSMKRKLARLLETHSVHLLYPVAVEKWIVRETAVGHPLTRRKSSRHGQTLDLFHELVHIPHLFTHPNLTIGVLLTQQEEIWRDDGRGSWRRKHWSKHDRHLLAVIQEVVFKQPTDFLALLPADLPQPFTNKQLAQSLTIRPRLAQRLTYTLHHTGTLDIVGKQGNATLYQTR